MIHRPGVAVALTGSVLMSAACFDPSPVDADVGTDGSTQGEGTDGSTQGGGTGGSTQGGDAGGTTQGGDDDGTTQGGDDDGTTQGGDDGSETGPSGPGIAGVSVLNATAAEVAQGRSATLVVDGNGLASVTAIEVDDSLSCIIDDQSDTEIRCALTVPHGHPLMMPQGAPRAVDVVARDDGESLPGGEEALTITPITIDAEGGSNSTGRGTTADPYQTLTFALVDGVEGGDRVVLRPGTYVNDAGEEWPLAWEGDSVISGLGDGVRLVSTDDALDFLGGWSGPEGPTTSQLRNVELVGFRTAVHVTGGRLELHGVTIDDAAGPGISVGGGVVDLAGEPTAVIDGLGPGIAVQGDGTLNAAGAMVSGNAGAGLAVAAGSVVWNGGAIEQNGEGNEFSDGSNVYIAGGTVSFEGTEQQPVRIGEAPLTNLAIAGGQVELVRTHVDQAGQTGVVFLGGSVMLTDSLVTASGFDGFSTSSAATGSIEVRDTVFADNGEAGFRADGGGVSYDLGVAGMAGNNRFENNGSNAQVEPDGQLIVDYSANDPFGAVGTTFVQGASTVTPSSCEFGPGSSTPPEGIVPDWRITEPQVLRFNLVGECD